MKNAFTRRLLQCLMLSSSLLSFACVDSGAPSLKEPEQLDTLSQELKKMGRSHVDIGSSAGGFVTEGFTCGSGNDITPTCGSDTENVNLGWTAPATGSYTISTVGSLFDTVLQVSKVDRLSRALTPVSCNDDDAVSAPSSSVTLTANAGDQFLITVDGFGCGYFQLHISAPACSAPNQCQAGPGTWNRSVNACVYAPLSKGTTCNDGNSATINDSCDGAGACKGVSSSCSATIACGGFECAGPVPAGSDFTILYGGNTSLSPWTIRGDGVDKMNGSVYVAQEGNVSLDMNARERGSVSQTITTTPGQKYEVTFWTQWNTHPGPASLVVSAHSPGSTLPGKLQMYGWATVNQSYPTLDWEKHTFEFTATGSSTVLSFNSPTPGIIGARLDAVSIACLPE